MEIKFEDNKNRSAAYIDGKEVGESTFSVSDKFWIIDHTEVDKKYEGQGIARKLVDKIVETAREKNIKLMATCPYALKLFNSDPQYKDVLYK